MRTGVVFGLMQLQAKECQGLVAATSNGKRQRKPQSPQKEHGRPC